MEINKQIFGNRTIDQIPLPTSRTRIIKGQKQVHFYTFEEYKAYFETGILSIIDETAWTDIENYDSGATTPNPRPKKNENDNLSESRLRVPVEQ